VVLLVDDEICVLDVETRIVERAGLRCLHARSGAEAVAVLRDHPEVALVLLDAILPDTSGERLFAALKEVKPSVRVIVCSGMAEHGPAQAMCDAGADDLVAKPFTAGDLMGRVQSVLGGTA